MTPPRTDAEDVMPDPANQSPITDREPLRAWLYPLIIFLHVVAAVLALTKGADPVTTIGALTATLGGSVGITENVRSKVWSPKSVRDVATGDMAPPEPPGIERFDAHDALGD